MHRWFSFAQPRQGFETAARRVATATVVIAALVLIGLVCERSRYGFDFTDDAFYLIWMATPFAYKASTSQFGFVYHPFYTLVGGDVALLRMLNYGLIVVLAWLATMQNTIKSDPGDAVSAIGWATRAGLLLALASTSLLVTAFELPQSPSYNTLAFSAILFSIIAKSFADEPSAYATKLLCWAAIGTACATAFLAKPTTGIILGTIWFVYALTATRTRIALLSAAAGAALLVLIGFAWAVDGSIVGFVTRIQEGIRLQVILGGKNTLGSIWRWEPFPLEQPQLRWLLLGSVASSLLILSNMLALGAARCVGAICCCALAVFAVFISFRGYLLPIPFERFDALEGLALPIGCIVASAVSGSYRSLDRSRVIFLALLVLLPFVYAFGTNRPYWLNAEGGMFFWMLAGALLLVPGRDQVGAMLPVGAVAVLVATIFVVSSHEHPQRQTQPLRLDANELNVGRAHGRIFVSDDFGAYVDGLRKLAKAGDFKAGTPVIDLTGHSPGAVYLLGGAAPGTPWLPGGYAGSRELAVAALSLVACDRLAQAWLLTEPAGEEKQPPDLLRRFGFDSANDYQDLGAVQATTALYSATAQHLLKPRGAVDDVSRRCQATR